MRDAAVSHPCTFNHQTLDGPYNYGDTIPLTQKIRRKISPSLTPGHRCRRLFRPLEFPARKQPPTNSGTNTREKIDFHSGIREIDKFRR